MNQAESNAAKIYGGKSLYEWVISRTALDFKGQDYPTRLKHSFEHLCNSVFPEVEKGASLAEAIKNRAPIYLNNHGRKHVEDVLRIETELLEASQCEITAYEAYILVFATLLHDVGNIFGRSKHETKCLEIIRDELGAIAGSDVTEKSLIVKIAQAHGGLVEGKGKDTINQLQPKVHVLSNPVRAQFLAALLRLADELADDRTRASRFMLEKGLLEGSEAFHAYSYALHSVVIEADEVHLTYEFDRATATRQLKKLNGEVYLIDEIIERLTKLHCERLYCMQFLGAQVRCNRVKVSIEVVENFDSGPVKTLKAFNFTLGEKGYPNLGPDGLRSVCSELEPISGSNLNTELQGAK